MRETTVRMPERLYYAIQDVARDIERSEGQHISQSAVVCAALRIALDDAGRLRAEAQKPIDVTSEQRPNGGC